MRTDLSPTITAREYVSSLSRVTRALALSPRLKLGRLSLPTSSPKRAIKVLAELVQRQPNDRAAHRLLGIAYLRHGNPKAAVKHLELALRLLRCATAARTGLYDTLYIQCEAALLRLLLARLYRRQLR
ncbi:MAG: tetratricopeptide repeat protein [Candidatus Methylomirabilia bacterium]